MMYDFPSFHHNLRKVGEIRIKQHHLGNLPAGVAAVRNSNRTVCFPKSQEVIHSIPRHSHLMSLTLQRLYDLLLCFGVTLAKTEHVSQSLS